MLTDSSDYLDSPPSSDNSEVSYFPQDLLNPDEVYESPSRVAQVTHANTSSIDEQRAYARNLLHAALDGNRTVTALNMVIDAQIQAVHILSSVGYMNLRHLVANGITMPVIARDLGLNLLDLMSFMSSHPQSQEHAVLDSLCCADSIMADLMESISTTTMITKYDADKLKQLVYATEMLCKRLSPQWIGAFDKIKAGEAAGAGGLEFNMYINSTSAPPQVVNEQQNLQRDLKVLDMATDYAESGSIVADAPNHEKNKDAIR